jgi:hypothetical protein
MVVETEFLELEDLIQILHKVENPEAKELIKGLWHDYERLKNKIRDIENNSRAFVKIMCAESEVTKLNDKRN